MRAFVRDGVQPVALPARLPTIRTVPDIGLSDCFDLAGTLGRGKRGVKGMVSDFGRYRDGKAIYDLSFVIPEFASANIRDRRAPDLSIARGLSDPGSPAGMTRQGVRDDRVGNPDDRSYCLV